MASIEFWRSGEWTMIYKDGQLVQHGDHHLADEWLRELAGVRVVDDEAGVCMLDGVTPLLTLKAVHAADDERAERLELARDKRRDAARLLAEAEELEAKR